MPAATAREPAAVEPALALSAARAAVAAATATVNAGTDATATGNGDAANAGTAGTAVTPGTAVTAGTARGAGSPPDAVALARALGSTGALLASWPATHRRRVAREAVLLRDLLGPAGLRDGGVGALALCLARPASEPLWQDFQRLQELLGQLETELSAQRRRARLPGAAGRRAAAEAAGTRSVLARAAGVFAATWASGHPGASRAAGASGGTGSDGRPGPLGSASHGGDPEYLRST